MDIGPLVFQKCLGNFNALKDLSFEGPLISPRGQLTLACFHRHLCAETHFLKKSLLQEHTVGDFWKLPFLKSSDVTGKVWVFCIPTGHTRPESLSFRV